MKDKLTNLIDVKTIVTLTLLFSSIIFVFMGIVKPDPILDLLQMAVAFYFGMKIARKEL